MSDQTIATLVGLAVVVVLRVLDWYLPRGHHSKWAEKHGVEHKHPPAEEEDEEG